MNFKCNSLSELAVLFNRHQLQRKSRIVKAVREAAKKTKKHIDENTIPNAFGELKGSGHVEKKQGGADVVYDAPHAAAVEVGSRPHWVPLDKIVAWVKKRAIQGLTAGGRTRRKFGKRFRGSSTARNARLIAAQLRAMRNDDGSTPIDAPLQIAKEIQIAIAKGGTQPTWFAKRALPAAQGFVAELVNAALPDKP